MKSVISWYIFVLYWCLLDEVVFMIFSFYDLLMNFYFFSFLNFFESFEGIFCGIFLGFFFFFLDYLILGVGGSCIVGDLVSVFLSCYLNLYSLFFCFVFSCLMVLDDNIMYIIVYFKMFVWVWMGSNFGRVGGDMVVLFFWNMV